MNEGKKRMFRRNDIILVLIIFLLAIAILAGRKLFIETPGAYAIVKVDGEVEGKYPLDEDREVAINNGTNHLQISNGSALMKSANCPDKICIKHKPIDSNGESIICLPNKVVIEIEGGNESELDAITN
ncbi:MAG: NusG domain II-containing protein [Suipraeoptans sp.]